MNRKRQRYAFGVIRLQRTKQEILEIVQADRTVDPVERTTGADNHIVSPGADSNPPGQIWTGDAVRLGTVPQVRVKQWNVTVVTDTDM